MVSKIGLPQSVAALPTNLPAGVGANKFNALV
jgi:hypothetical protein